MKLHHGRVQTLSLQARTAIGIKKKGSLLKQFKQQACFIDISRSRMCVYLCTDLMSKSEKSAKGRLDGKVFFLSGAEAKSLKHTVAAPSVVSFSKKEKWPFKEE